ncbi:phosphatidylglycerol lysyltransferase domain-containing protein [Roseovarius rhodophyticola]|uniref:Phosphatidylglycerol lysyltransferase domain-containing protein n=1 Tax=Roseovarius rhodophyticola TaxID=3080827 RepID=A0ABZ2TEH5_9RHOB|nr:phosphatidylglycerol lysyltransferase domain-containing protein [Roseovarius sp. W115]MDV2928334.1 phosphatidylglycerol lysyltransferase domain-containing protein [Roseovarius sp. W115]
MFTLAWGKTPATVCLRHVMPFFIGALCLWIVQDQLTPDSLTGLGAALSNLTFKQWAVAGLATTASFWALGRYDVILHQHLRTDCRPRHACASGVAAIAIGQTIGLGVLSGALVRWRLVPDLSLVQATKIATGVAVSFLSGLVLCLGLMGVLFPSDVLSFHQGLFCLIFFCNIGLLCFLYPKIRLGRSIFRGPSLRMLGGIAGLALIDTFCAGVALWCLMPSGTELPLVALMPAYMLALGAALLSGTPGGVGPFELVLLAALPGIPQAEVLCGIVAFRLIYYALPFGLAACMLLRPFTQSGHSEICRRDVHERDLKKAPRAEIGLCRQADAGVIASRHVSLPVLRPGQSLCLLFAALGGATEAALATLKKQAHREMLFPLVYKADGRMAAVATKSGWRALHVADDLVLKPSEFQTEGRAFRQLRRKLRQAEQAGLSIERGTALPWKELAQVDADWQARQGRARGMTMGQFCPEYLSHQGVFLARLKGRVVAFASFHISTDEWCLDLMRANAPVPDGTMHALITAAIDAADEAGVPQFCLAALPPERGPIAWLAAKSGYSTGLSQFKKSFNPKRSPRYALAPSWGLLALGLGDLLRAVRRPNRNLSHNHHENNEFARARGV